MLTKCSSLLLNSGMFPLFQICMFFSAFYHLFCCHSERVFHLWLSLDLAGVSLGVCACYVPAVYYAFYCHVVRDIQCILDYIFIQINVSGNLYSIYFNPLTPTSDQDRVSPYTSDTTWSRQVMRKKKIKIMDY